MLKDILIYSRELSHRRKYLLMIGVYMLLTLVLRLLSFFSFYILGDVSRFSLKALALILGGITALEILTQAIGYFSGLIEAKVITQTAQNLQNKIFTRLLHAKPTQVAQLTGAEIQTTLQEALPAYVEFASMLSNFAIVFPAGLVVTVICFVLDWRLFVLSIGLCVLELVLSKKVQQVKAKRRGITMESLTRATATLLDGVHAALSMRWLPSLSRQMTSRYKKAVNEAAAAEKSEQLTGTLASLLQSAVSVAGQISFLALGAWQIARGNTSLSVFLALYSVRTSLIDVFVLYTGLRGSYLEFEVNRQRLARLLDLQPEPQSAKRTCAPDLSAETALSLEGVSFSYDAGHPVIENLSFSLETGSCCRLFGRSGQGKTTVYSLLCGMLEPDQGEILCFGAPVSALPPKALRGLVTYMSQRFYLFHGSIANNIRLGCPAASDEAVRNAARAAQLEDWIATLPQGYDTVLQNNASTLSAGQRQRLMIARALVADHPIWLMDEVTASLDRQTARELEKTLLPLMEQRTVLYSSHREDGLFHPDRTIAL